MVILHLVTIDLTSTASRPVKSLKTDVAVLDGSTKTVSHKNEVAPKKTLKNGSSNVQESVPVKTKHGCIVIFYSLA